jgi:hypothetical protein
MRYIATFYMGSGIGSVMVGIMNSLLYMYKKKIYDDLYIYDKDSSNLIKTFYNKYIFFYHKKIKHTIYKNNDDIELAYTQIVIQELQHFDKNERKIMESFFYNEYFSFNDNITNIIKLNKIPSIGIMVRRGDKITLENHIRVAHINEYLDIINTREKKDLYIATDDYTQITEFKKHIEDVQFSIDEKSKGFFLIETFNWTDEQISEHLIKFCKELYILMNVELCIVPISTNSSTIIQYGRKIDFGTFINI